jgi:hypothetical protein
MGEFYVGLDLGQVSDYTLRGQELRFIEGLELERQ